MTDPTPTPVDPRQRQLVIFGVALSLIFAVGIVALLIFRTQLAASTLTPTTTLPVASSASGGVSAIDIPFELIDFTLPGKDGEPLSLSDLRGKYTLVFFGYTHCPDVCPLTLAEFKQVSDDLGDAAGDVNFLFISVDGERDTPEVLTGYVNRFNPAFYAMQGNAAVLETIAGDYGLVYALYKESETDADYAVDHSTSAYLVDPQGRLVATIGYGTDSDVITQALQARM